MSWFDLHVKIMLLIKALIAIGLMHGELTIAQRSNPESPETNRHAFTTSSEKANSSQDKTNRTKREPQLLPESLLKLRSHLEAVGRETLGESPDLPSSDQKPLLTGRSSYPPMGNIRPRHLALDRNPLLPGRSFLPTLEDVQPPHLAIDQDPFAYRRLLRLRKNRARTRYLFLPNPHTESDNTRIGGDVFPHNFRDVQEIGNSLSGSLSPNAQRHDVPTHDYSSEARIFPSEADHQHQRDVIVESPSDLAFASNTDAPDLTGIQPELPNDIRRTTQPLSNRDIANFRSSDVGEKEYLAIRRNELGRSFQQQPLPGVTRNEFSLLPEVEIEKPLENFGSIGDKPVLFGSIAESKPVESMIPEAIGAEGYEGQDEHHDGLKFGSPFPNERRNFENDENLYPKKKTSDFLLSTDNEDDPLDEYVRRRCHPNPCAHGSKCTETRRGFQCSCVYGFKGPRCRERNYCLPNPCANNGVCTESNTDDLFSCACREDYVGKVCEARRNACTSKLCQNYGECIPDGTVSFTCVCKRGTSGKLCQDGSLQVYESGPESITSSILVNVQRPGNYEKDAIQIPAHGRLAHELACAANPCMNGAFCRTDSTVDRGYTCDCAVGYLGVFCEEMKCKCLNGGSCIGEGPDVQCKCATGFTGVYCSERSQCSEDSCLPGGVCLEEAGGFRCKCENGYHGSRCEVLDKCQPNPCLHGSKCKSHGDAYICDCRPGYKGKQCEDLDFCHPNPCENSGLCFASLSGFQCECPPGFGGQTCADSLYCASNPCLNGAKCVEAAKNDSLLANFKCLCREGFTGDVCAAQDHCYINPCLNAGTCHNQNDGFTCTCSENFKGIKCETFNRCASSPCWNGATCTSEGSSYVCKCGVGYKGPNCEEADYCQPSPCKNHGICSASKDATTFLCSCMAGYRGPTCEDLDPCFPNPCVHGTCSEIHGGFTCNCSTGFKGVRCSEINHCEPNPCYHDGRCQGVVGGLGFQCQCQPGYRGLTCQLTDSCYPEPCRNGGTCLLMNVSEPRHPWSHDVHSLMSDVGYSCSCVKGFLGRTCEVSDPCYPNPCLHNSSCIAMGGMISCNCNAGWKGRHCDVVDLCHPDPCRFGTHCIQTDKESYQCVKNTCSPSPCKNGGECIVVNQNTYECACTKGWRGKNCDDTDACYPNPCGNQGICHIKNADRFTCECPVGFQGPKCQAHFCTTYPCRNGGTCIEIEGGFTCRCIGGYSGPFCEDRACLPNPCMNGGTCVAYFGTGLCKCPSGFTGFHCTDVRHDLVDSPVLPMTDSHASRPHHPATKADPRQHPSAETASTQVVNLTESSYKLSSDGERGSPFQASDIQRSGYSPNEYFPPHALLTGYTDYMNVLREHISRPVVERTNKQEIGSLGYSSGPKYFPHDECFHCDKEAGICVDGHCICRSGFVGDGLECWRETSADRVWSCKVNPCQNGGTCIDGQAKCVCRLGFTGTLCEHYCPPIVHLDFDRVSGVFVVDENGNHNDALLSNGAEIVHGGGKCGSGAALLGGDVLFHGPSFSPKPLEAVTVAVWVKLDTSRGIQSIFDTVGGKASSHREGQYHLEINDGRVRWFHRNEHQVTVFSVLSQPVVTAGNWTHIVGTYNAMTGVAKLYVNGDVVGKDNGSGYLSQDWDGKAGIGRHEHIFGNRLLRGMVDEFYIFGCALPRLEILVLMEHCKIYWKPPERSPAPSATSANLMVMHPAEAEFGVFASPLGNGSNLIQEYYGFDANPSSSYWRSVNYPTSDIVGRRKVTVDEDLEEGNGYAKNVVLHPDEPLIEQPSGSVVRGRMPIQPIPNFKLTSALPHGSSTLGHEFRDVLSGQRIISPDRRMQILALEQPRFAALQKQLYLKSKPWWSAQHHAPATKIESKKSQFSQHTYFNLPRPSVILTGPGVAYPGPGVHALLSNIRSPSSSKYLDPILNDNMDPSTKKSFVLNWSDFPPAPLAPSSEDPRSFPGRNQASTFSQAAFKYSRFPKSLEDVWNIWRKRHLDKLLAAAPVVRPDAALSKSAVLAGGVRTGSRLKIPLLRPSLGQEKYFRTMLTASILPRKLEVSSLEKASIMLPVGVQNDGAMPVAYQPPSVDALSYDAYRKAHPTRPYYQLSEREAYNRWMKWENNMKAALGSAAALQTHPSMPQSGQQVGQPDRRWFKWLKGAAAVNGGTITHTHSSTTQINSPGTISTQTHVSSSQNAGGSSNIKNYFQIQASSPDIRTMWNRFVEQQRQRKASKRLATSKTDGFGANVASSLVRIDPDPMMVYSRRWGYGNGVVSPARRGSDGGWGSFARDHIFLPNTNLSTGPPPWIDSGQTQRRPLTTTHSHQWGYGNGNGQGNGIGTPGGSGSGGGWGAGGPLFQNLSLPGWSGNPGEGPPWGEKAQEKLKQMQKPQQKRFGNPQRFSLPSARRNPWSVNPWFGTRSIAHSANLRTVPRAILNRPQIAHHRSSEPSSYRSLMTAVLGDIPDGLQLEAMRKLILRRDTEGSVKRNGTRRTRHVSKG